MYYRLETERLILRPIDMADLETVHEYASDEDNTRYMIFLPNRTVEETIEFLTYATKEWEKDSPNGYEFAITLNGHQIGAISVTLDETREIAELGWILSKKHQKQGYALEAALAIKDFAIETLKIKKLTAHCDSRNVPSYRLMEKIGMTMISDDGIRQYIKRNETARELTYCLML